MRGVTRRISLAASLAAFLVAALCSTASAAIVTVGSPLTQSFEPASINGLVTFANSKLPEVGANVTSPVSGAVIRWHILDASGGPFKLRVLHPLVISPPVVPARYVGSGTSAAEIPSDYGLQTFSTALPITKGDLIGLDDGQSEGDQIGYVESLVGAELEVWEPPFLDGGVRKPTEAEPGEVAFNAEVQPQPNVVSVSPSSGSVKGGTSVVITGSDFEGTTAVTFGNAPARRFTVESESQITAVAPPMAAIGDNGISVKTVAGYAGHPFIYEGCKVPTLKGSGLRHARRHLKRVDCELGKVTKGAGVTAKTGRILKQHPRPGKILASGSNVRVWLGR